MDRELSIQKLSPEHEAKLAELMAPGSAVEQRAYQDTVTGEFRRREGITERTDHEAVERIVDETRQLYRTRFGRELTAAEAATTRKQAELRSVLVTGGRGASTSHELAAVHGWGVLVKPANGEGIAMRQTDGSYTGDPVIAAKAQAADDAARARLGHITNIARTHHVGPPT